MKEYGFQAASAFPAISALLLKGRQSFRNLRMIERRRLQRLQIRCAVSLWKPSDGTFTRTVTENLTSSGFFLLSRESYLPGDKLEATLEVPARSSNGGHTGCLHLQCQVEVLRIDDRQSGIACRIKEYTVLPNRQVS